MSIEVIALRIAVVCLLIGLFLGLSTLAVFIKGSFPVVAEEVSHFQKKNGFSVKWMGFLPDYRDDYPEYYIVVNDLRYDQLRMSIALKIVNQEASGYYFKVEQHSPPPDGWTIEPQEIGFIDKDQSITFVYTGAVRDKPDSIPGGKLTETIDLSVKAYYDAAYTNLYSEDNFTVTFNFIDRTSGWIILEVDNFDDGTTEDWTWTTVSGGSCDVSITPYNNLYRSFPFSLRLSASTGWGGCVVAFRKTFSIGSVSEAYLVFSIRSERFANGLPEIRFNGETFFKPDATPLNNIWYQITIPLPSSSDVMVDIVSINVPSSSTGHAYLDEVYVIVKP